MERKFYSLGLFALTFCLIGTASAQVDVSKLPDGTAGGCNNGSFESGNFDNWQRYTGKHPEAYKYWPDPEGVGCCEQEGFVTMGIDTPADTYVQNATTGNWEAPTHTLVTPGKDETITTLDRVPAAGGNYSLRLGNKRSGGDADRIETTFTVSAENPVYRYRFALVMNEPGHNEEDQPFFEVGFYDANGDLIPGTHKYVSGPEGNDDFVEYEEAEGIGIVVYRDWETETKDLSDYAGKDVTVKFTVADCAHGAHYGYAYINPECGLAKTTLTTETERIDYPAYVSPEIRLFPNPASKQLYLQGTNLKQYDNLQVVNLTGNVVANKQLNSQTFTQVSVGEFANGMYLLSLKSATKSECHKFVVVK